MGGGREKKASKRFPHIVKTQSTTHLKDGKVFIDVCTFALDKMRADVVDIVVKDKRFAQAVIGDSDLQSRAWRYVLETDSSNVLDIIYTYTNWDINKVLLPLNMGPNHIQVMTDHWSFNWRDVKIMHMHIFNCYWKGCISRKNCWCHTQQAQDLIERALARRRMRIDMMMRSLEGVVAERNLRLLIVARTVIMEARSANLKTAKHMHIEDMDVVIIACMYHLSEDHVLTMHMLDVCEWIESKMVF